MQIRPLLATAALAAAAAPAARADDDNTTDDTYVSKMGAAAQSLYYDDGTADDRKSAECLFHYDRLHARGIPDERPIELSYEVRTPAAVLPAHSKTTLGALRAICQAADRKASGAKLESDSLYGIAQLYYELPVLSINDVNAAKVKNCFTHYQAAIDAGVDPAKTVTIPEGQDYDASHTSPAWTGTFGALKDTVCAKGQAAYDALWAKKLAPYKAAGIKGDKLQLIIDYIDVAWWLPGAGSTPVYDAKRLAKASVWFQITEGDACDGGRTVHNYRRYQFDRNQKIAKTTDREYCGDPGAKALK